VDAYAIRTIGIIRHKRLKKTKKNIELEEVNSAKVGLPGDRL